MAHLTYTRLLVLAIAVITASLTPLRTRAHDSHHQHRAHGAHVHGSAQLNIAFDGKNGKIDFKAASEGVVGFEHLARSAQDKKTLADVISKFELNTNTLVQFDAKLNCKYKKEKAEMTFDHEHSDFIAIINVACDAPVVGSKITVNFSDFKNIHDLDITVLADNIQKTAESKGAPITIDLK